MEYCAAELREVLRATSGELLGLREARRIRLQHQAPGVPGPGGRTSNPMHRGQDLKSPDSEAAVGARLSKRPLQDSNLGPSD